MGNKLTRRFDEVGKGITFADAVQNAIDNLRDEKHLVTESKS